MTDEKRLLELATAMRALASEWERSADAIRLECARDLRERLRRLVQR